MQSKIDQQLEKIKEEVLVCKKCPLHLVRAEGNFYPVIGEGSHQAKIMFIGEAPGLQEAKTGRPFCGKAGIVLDELLAAVDIKRSEVYITNILKDRPPSNRDPQAKEITACVGYLKRQIELIKPKIICSLGRYAMEFLMSLFGLEKEIQGISKIHGKMFKVADFVIIPFYHPAVATYNPNMKKTLLEDFKVLKTDLLSAKEVKEMERFVEDMEAQDFFS